MDRTRKEAVPEEELSTRRLRREDGTLGPPLRRPWRQWDILARADIAAALLTAAAIAFTALVMLRLDAPGTLPSAYSVVSPLIGVAFFVALIAQFLERERHGAARALLVGGSVVLAIAGIAFTGKVGAGHVLLTYWIPALLGLGAAIVLVRGHARARKSADARVRLPRVDER